MRNLLHVYTHGRVPPSMFCTLLKLMVKCSLFLIWLFRSIYRVTDYPALKVILYLSSDTLFFPSSSPVSLDTLSQSLLLIYQLSRMTHGSVLSCLLFSFSFHSPDAITLTHELICKFTTISVLSLTGHLYLLSSCLHYITLGSLNPLKFNRCPD